MILILYAHIGKLDDLPTLESYEELCKIAESRGIVIINECEAIYPENDIHISIIESTLIE